MVERDAAPVHPPAGGRRPRRRHSRVARAHRGGAPVPVVPGRGVRLPGPADCLCALVPRAQTELALSVARCAVRSAPKPVELPHRLLPGRHRGRSDRCRAGRRATSSAVSGQEMESGSRGGCSPRRGGGRRRRGLHLCSARPDGHRVPDIQRHPGARLGDRARPQFHRPPSDSTLHGVDRGVPPERILDHRWARSPLVLGPGASTTVKLRPGIYTWSPIRGGYWLVEAYTSSPNALSTSPLQFWRLGTPQ